MKDIHTRGRYKLLRTIIAGCSEVSGKGNRCQREICRPFRDIQHHLMRSIKICPFDHAEDNTEAG